MYVCISQMPQWALQQPGGLFRAAYAQWQQLTIMRDNQVGC
jgi:hypothetical protein